LAERPLSEKSPAAQKNPRVKGRAGIARAAAKHFATPRHFNGLGIIASPLLKHGLLVLLALDALALQPVLELPLGAVDLIVAFIFCFHFLNQQALCFDGCSASSREVLDHGCFPPVAGVRPARVPGTRMVGDANDGR
jgi:hypothetical protein